MLEAPRAAPSVGDAVALARSAARARGVTTGATTSETVTTDSTTGTTVLTTTSTSVIETAYSCGFLHLGRFGADHRKKCCVSPSHTLHAGRWTNVAHGPATRLR